MGDYKVWTDEDGIIRCILSGAHDRQDAEAVMREIIKLSKEKGRARVLIDLSKAKESTSDERRVYINTIKTVPEIFEKLAFFGKSAMNKVMANFIITGSGKEEKVRYFEGEGKALRWLKE